MAGLENRLVEVGVQLLESTGPDRLGLREIARQAGVSHGAPRRYFPTHQLLLAAVAKSGLTDLTAQMERVFTGPQPARERLRVAAHEYVGFAQARPEMFRLIFRHDLHRGSGYSLRVVWLPLLDAMAAMVAQASPAVDDPRERGLLIWTHVHGIATFAAGLTLEPAGLDTQVDSLVEKAVQAQLS
ncbi:TetR/AcrR family transcriptional regulator [Kineosporia sp. NBRC 101731]|uniref:TetR/AcrR family transcriptional regulator n=1 Tax=Kineosporia sp. NBRC 101731 TaxID=3032199 RepID=UPI0025547876|nr:TetR/AcrR family transcriptional regulator [Kineosporia sp. NBRC 101731]